MSLNEHEQRELERLAALYRRLPRAEPPAALDQAILARAHAAVAAPRVVRWTRALATAAVLVVAVGIGWTLRDRGEQRDVAPALATVPTPTGADTASGGAPPAGVPADAPKPQARELRERVAGEADKAEVTSAPQVASPQQPAPKSRPAQGPADAMQARASAPPPAVLERQKPAADAAAANAAPARDEGFVADALSQQEAAAEPGIVADDARHDAPVATMSAPAEAPVEALREAPRAFADKSLPERAASEPVMEAQPEAVSPAPAPPPPPAPAAASRLERRATTGRADGVEEKKAAAHEDRATQYEPRQSVAQEPESEATGRLGATGAGERKQRANAKLDHDALDRSSPRRWLAAIRELIAHDEIERARDELAQLRKRHPHTSIPADVADRLR